VELLISRGVAIQEDAIASIRTKGLIGEKFVQIMPGGSDKIIPSGGKIRETESAIDVEELISKYAFGKI
jgi:phospholipid/cholesterol/gamma-HCH transport system substrate-binding protein